MQRDYILRMIEQAGAVLKELLSRIRTAGASRADLTTELRRAAQLGGLDLELLRIADAAGLLHFVSVAGEPEPARTWLAAETLHVDAMAAEAEGDVEAALESYAKAASLFRLLEPGWVLPTGFPEATERIDDISRRLNDLGTADRADPTSAPPPTPGSPAEP